MATELKMRHPPPSAATVSHTSKKDYEKKHAEASSANAHPSGAAKHGTWTQALRMLLFFVYFNGGCIA